ncbi:MAG: LytTR family DNA-binding domain-containing protein [Pseudoflavonifractor sp.]|nr:LytTR family DNA-binding domain-containing protein [Pseudoflavonifractor sp.]
MKCIIIDDEPMARKGMKRLVESRPELQLAAMLDSAESAEEWLGGNDVDLIFLDIEMPGINGIEFAKTLPPRTMVLFTTAYADYAVDGFEVDALDYLVKPIDPDRFNKAVDRAISYKSIVDDSRSDMTDALADSIIVKADRKYVRIKSEDILFVEGLKDYVIIHLPEKKVVTRMTIKAMEETLPRKKFLRVNKSYIVNKDKIDSFDNNDIYVGPAEIAIGLSYRDTVLDSLLK